MKTKQKTYYECRCGNLRSNIPYTNEVCDECGTIVKYECVGVKK